LRSDVVLRKILELTNGFDVLSCQQHSSIDFHRN
jgi:hypothetical protein